MILEEILHFFAVDGFDFEKCLRHRFQDFHVCRQGGHGVVVSFVQVLVHFFIDDGGYGFAIVSFRAQLLAQEDLFLVFAENHRPQAFAHAPFHDHLTEDAGHLLQVAGSAAGNFIENDLLCAAATQCDAKLCQEVRLGDEGAFLMRKHHGVATGLASGDNGDLVYRVCILQEGSHDSVAGFVVSGDFSFLFADLVTSSFRTVADFFAGFFQIGHGNGLSVSTSGQKCCFIQQVCDVCTGEARYFLRNGFQIHIRFQRFVLCMDFQDRDTAAEVRTTYHDATVKAAGTKQCRIQNIRTVRCRQSDDAFIGAEAIHFDQELVQCLFAFVMAAAKAAATLTPHRIDFIDEDDAWCILLRLRKEVADAGCADADKHFYEVRAGNGEERNLCFPGYGFGQKSFTGTGRSYQEDTLRDFRADSGIAARIFQEVYHFGKLFLRFIFTGYVGEVDVDLAFSGHFRSGFTKAHDTSTAALGLVHDPEPHTYQNDDRQQGGEQAHPPSRLFRRLRGDDHFAFGQSRQKSGVIVRCIGSKFRAILQLTGNGIVRHRYGVYILLFHLGDEVAIGDLRMLFLGMHKGIEYGHRYDDQKHIESHILYKFTQYFPPSLYFFAKYKRPILQVFTPSV